KRDLVAPFTGARIETSLKRWTSSSRWVAPFTGARIETPAFALPHVTEGRRSLHGSADRNFGEALAGVLGDGVAPFTGARIETSNNSRACFLPPSRSLHGSADRNICLMSPVTWRTNVAPF